MTDGDHFIDSATLSRLASCGSSSPSRQWWIGKAKDNIHAQMHRTLTMDLKDYSCSDIQWLSIACWSAIATIVCVYLPLVFFLDIRLSYHTNFSVWYLGLFDKSGTSTKSLTETG